MTEKPLRLLVVEDQRSDFLLIRRQLERSNLPAEFHLVASDAALQDALADAFDAALCDYNVPGMTFENTLRQIRARCADLPVILVSGGVGEERAVDLLRIGLTDFVLKDNLQRLGRAIVRAIDERKERVARREVEERLRASEARVLEEQHRARLEAIDLMQQAIAARAEAETANELLRDSERRLKMAQDGAHIGVWEHDLRTDALYLSAEAARLFGLPQQKTHGKAEWRRQVHPADLPGIEARWRESLETHAPLAVEYRVLTEGGGLIWVSSKGAPQYDDAGAPLLFSGIVADVTERKEAEIALAESEARLALFIEHAPAALAMLDCRLRYLSMSRRWREDYRLGDGPLIGESFVDTVPALARTSADALQGALAGQMSTAQEDSVDMPDGATRRMRWEARSWRIADGAIGGVLLFSEDITDRHAARLEILRLNADLERRVWVRTMELQEARKKAEVVSERLQMAIDAGAIGAWDLDTASGVAVVDGNLRNMFGFDPRETITVDLVDGIVHPDDLPVARASRDTALAAGEGAIYTADYRIRRRNDGAERWISARAQIRGEPDSAPRIVGITRDITDEKRLELSLLETARLADAVRESEERLRAVIDGAGDAIISTDQTGAIESINAAGVKIFGFEPDEIIGENVRTLMAENHQADHDGLMRRYLDAGDYRRIGLGRPVEGRRKNGELFPMELTVSAARHADRRFLVGFIRDLTELRRAEADIEKLRSDRLKAIGGMAAALAHEINQPFQTSVAYIDIARERLRNPHGGDGVNAEHALELASRHIVRVGHIITHLREFVSSGEPDKTFRNLHDLVRDALASMTDSLARSGIVATLRLEAANDRVLVDRVQIRQVLLNLMRNAREAMSRCETRRLSVTTACFDEFVRVDIADTGIGLPKETLDRLFEPFVTTKDSGMGVGLAISRSIIEAHYGELHAAANSDGGATFSFTLPLEPPPGE